MKDFRSKESRLSSTDWQRSNRPGMFYPVFFRDEDESFHSVGEPLPRPEHELPAYGRSLLLAVTGVLAVLVFLSQTIIAIETGRYSPSLPLAFRIARLFNSTADAMFDEAEEAPR